MGLKKNRYRVQSFPRRCGACLWCNVEREWKFKVVQFVCLHPSMEDERAKVERMGVCDRFAGEKK
jgi:hypothetical protein